MKLLPNLSHAVNKDTIAPVYIQELIDWLDIEDAKSLLPDDAKEQLSQLKAIQEAAKKLISIDDLTQVKDSVNGVISAISDSLNADQKKKLKDSGIVEKVDDALKILDVAVTPIRSQKDIEKQIDGKRETTLSIRDVPFTLGVQADASYGLYILDAKEMEQATTLKIADSMVAINHDISGKFGLSAGAATTLGSVQLGASINKTASVEVDAYFQLPGETSTASAMWQMLSQSFRPWDLTSVADILIPNNGESNTGYRMMSLKTEGELELNGSLVFGKSLSFEENVKDKTIKADISLGAEASYKYAEKGVKKLSVSKNDDGKIALRVAIDDKSTENSAWSAGLNADINGVDQLASQEMSRILGRSDELIDKLQALAKPKEIIKEAMTELTASNKTWLSKSLSLLLGEKEPDEVFKELVLNEIEEAFNTTPFSPKTDKKALADKFFDKVVSALDVDLGQIDPKLADPIEKAVKKGIEDLSGKIQTKVNEQYQKYIDLLKSKTEGQLEPIAKISQQSRELINKVNDITVEKIELIIAQYTEFKSKLEKGIQKAAKLKLEAKIKHERESSEQEIMSFTVIFKDTTDLSSQALYRSLLLGDNAKSRRLLALLRDNKVNIVDRSLRFITKDQATTSISVNLFGLGMQNVKDISTELDVSVSPSGDLNVEYTYAASAMAKGKYEQRRAVFDLSYTMASAAVAPEFNSALSLSYDNSDGKRHSVRELTDLFDSMAVNRAISEIDTKAAISPIFPAARLDKTLTLFKKTISEQTSKYYKSSEIRIIVKPSSEHFSSLINVKREKIASTSVPYLVALKKWPEYMRNVAQEILYMLMKQSKVDLSSHAKLMDYFVNEKPSPADIKEILEINKREYQARIKPYDSNTRTFRLGETPYESAVIDLRKLFKMSYALSNLPSQLSKIKSLSTKLIDDSESGNLIELLPAFNRDLKNINEGLERDLDEWIKVKSVFANSLEDFFSKLGLARSGMSYRLLSLFCILQAAMETDSLYQGTLTLVAKNEANNKVIDL